MRKFIIAIIALQLSLGFVEAQEINQLDANGDRHGVWKKYYPNKRVRYEGTFENGKEVGVFKFYSMNSSEKPMVVKTFEANSEEALVQFFSTKGIIESEGKMKEKQRIGKWNYYHNGADTIMIEENYEDGQLSGEYKLFYKNAQLTKLTHYKIGMQHGNCKQYTEAGVLIEDVNYVDGQLHGPAVYYETTGLIKQKGNYEEDLRVGIWEWYNDGQLVSSKEVIPNKE